MDYDHLLYDFTERTLKNLRVIEQHHKARDAEVFEVTQLINSALGLIVMPQQRFLDEIPNLTLKELQQMGWPTPVVMGNLPKADDLHELLRVLRNSVAHFHIEFDAEVTTQRITGLRLWNENKPKSINWQVSLSISELRDLVERFAALVLEQRSSKSNGAPTNQQ